MNNKKKLTIVIAVLAIVCVFAALVFSGVIDFNKVKTEETTGDSSSGFGSTAYKNDMTSFGDNKQPYLPTNIEDIFYSVSVEGKVAFYKYENKMFSPVDASGTYTTTVSLSETDVSAEITYYEQGAQITGFGLYTAKNGENNLTPYAFFRLTEYGNRYSGKSSKSCLLLIDTTEDDFYSADKIYEESFIFNFSDSSASRSLSEANRTVSITGAKRADYTLISDYAINNSVENQLFFSGRQYGEDDARVDLLRSGGSGNNTDNINIGKDVLCYWVYRGDDDKVLYLTENENGNVILVKADHSDGENMEVVKTFEGVSRNSILVCGNYMYISGKNIVYNLVDDTETEISISDPSMTVDAFATDGETTVIRGYTENIYPTLIIISDGKVKEYSNEFFANAVNIGILSDGSVIFATEQNGVFTTHVFLTAEKENYNETDISEESSSEITTE